jgi:hypothetical protein
MEWRGNVSTLFWVFYYTQPHSKIAHKLGIVLPNYVGCDTTHTHSHKHELIHTLGLGYEQNY